MEAFTKHDARIFSRYASNAKRYDLFMCGSRNGMDISVEFSHEEGAKYRVEVSIPPDYKMFPNGLCGDHHADTIPAAINGALRSFRKEVRSVIKEQERMLRKLNRYL